MSDLSYSRRFELPDGWYLLVWDNQLTESCCVLYDANDCDLMEGFMMSPEYFAESMYKGRQAPIAKVEPGLSEGLKSVISLVVFFVMVACFCFMAASR